MGLERTSGGRGEAAPGSRPSGKGKPSPSAGHLGGTTLEQRVRIGPARLFVRDEGEGEAFLLAHGMWCAGHMFDAMVAKLATTYRVITPDLRAHGRSGVPRSSWSVVDVAEDYLRVLDALRVERVILGGYSMGGMAAVHFALKYPGAALRPHPDVDQWERGALGSPPRARRAGRHRRPGRRSPLARPPGRLRRLYPGLSSLLARGRRAVDRSGGGHEPHGADPGPARGKHPAVAGAAPRGDRHADLDLGRPTGLASLVPATRLCCRSESPEPNSPSCRESGTAFRSSGREKPSS